MAYNPLARLRLGAYALPLALMAALVLVMINESGYRNALSAQRSTAERVDAQAELQELQRRLLDAETGQRGYLLSGREGYLEPYQSALASIPGTLQRLDVFYGSDQRRREPIRKIERAAQAKLSELALTLQLHREGKHEQWHQLMLSDIGREQMDELRRSVTLLRNVENESIRSNREALVRALHLSRLGIHLMALLALVALVLMLRKARALDRATAEHARALAAERDLLEQQVTRRTADLTELARHLQTAREDERARVARDLHDELGALLTATKLDAARLKRTLGHMSPEAEDRLKRLNATVDQGIAMKRRIIEDLRPSSLDNLGLKAALEIQAREFAQRTELVVRCELAAGAAERACTDHRVQAGAGIVDQHRQVRQGHRGDGPPGASGRCPGAGVGARQRRRFRPQGRAAACARAARHALPHRGRRRRHDGGIRLPLGHHHPGHLAGRDRAGSGRIRRRAALNVA